MTKIRRKRELIKRDEVGHMAPLARDVHSFDLNTGILDQTVSQRFLLIAGFSAIAIVALLGAYAFGLFNSNEIVVEKAPVANTTPNLASQKTDTAVLEERDLNDGYAYPQITQSELPYDSQVEAALESDVQATDTDGDNITTITKTPPPEPVDESFILTAGQNLGSELQNRGVPRSVAQAVIAAIDATYPSQNITPGTRFDVTFDRQIDFYGREITFPVELSFDQGKRGKIFVNSDEDGQLSASIEKPKAAPEENNATVAAVPEPKPTKPAQTQFRVGSNVGANISTTAQDNGVPEYIVAEFTRAFSYDVDFQRQVQATDKFEVLYGNPLSGSSAKRKVLHMARLTIDGRTRTLLRFTGTDGTTDYYDESGQSVARRLSRTPISGAKLTSNFGLRRHPILGYTKMHEGTDFGAPTGTPIRAAGSGTIQQAGRESGYGNTIIISHGKNMKTLYAHMSRFAAGIRRGSRVNQGQIIGYVGMTGRTSGPHLHYEVHINNRPVNPMGVRAAGGRKLSGKDLANFRAQRLRIMALMDKTPNNTQVGQLN